MKGANIRYILADSLRSVRGNMLSAVFTALTLGFSLAILALFAIVFVNLNTLVAGLGDKTVIVAYVKDSALAAGAERLKAEALGLPGVSAVEFISKEAALSELKSGFSGHEAIFEGVDANPLPASMEIRLKDSFKDPAKVTGAVARLKAMGWVEEVQYSAEWVERFSAFLRFVELGASVIGVFLGGAVLFIISNTIRLTVYARKDEIEIMRLVGASDTFIKAPFFIEGALQGFAGGLIALLILGGASLMLSSGMPAYLAFVVVSPLSTIALFLILVSAGVFMGVVGSLISMGRFLKV